MTIRDDARQEAERRWPEWLQAAKRDWLRGAFEAGAVWASEQADRGCGHPNHGAEAHDCAPFLPDREPSDAEQRLADVIEYAEKQMGPPAADWEHDPAKILQTVAHIARGENFRDSSERG